MIVCIFLGAKIIKKMNMGGNFRNFLVERNILVRNFADFINENPQSVNILYINISKEDSPSFCEKNDSVD